MSRRLVEDDEPLPLPLGAAVRELSPDLVVLCLPEPVPEVPPELTASEQEVAAHLCAGKRSTEIAEARGVSVSTIGNQVERLYKKVGVRSRSELVALLCFKRRLG